MAKVSNSKESCLDHVIDGGGDRNRTGVRESAKQDHYECSFQN